MDKGIKDLAPRLAYLRGYHRGRSTGRRRGIEAAANAVVEGTGNQSEFKLSAVIISEAALLDLIAKS